MKKNLKKKFIISIFVFILGIIICMYSYRIIKMSIIQQQFMKGFGIGLIVISVAVGINSSLLLSNPRFMIRAERKKKDERLQNIHMRAMAITFRTFTILEILVATGLIFTDNIIGTYLGLLVGAKLVCFVILDFLIGRKTEK